MVRQVERCREFIPLPDGEEGEIRCGTIAEDQCDECSDWFCPEHLFMCKGCQEGFSGKQAYCSNDLHTHSHEQMFMGELGD